MPTATPQKPQKNETVVDVDEVRAWPWVFQEVPVDQLMVDVYQRPLTSFVEQIVNNYRGDLLMPLPVSERRENKKYAVVDGQTRAKALELLGKPVAPCLVYRGMKLREEAALFSDIQRERRAMTSGSAFRARVVAEEPVAVAISEVLADYGYQVQTNSSLPGDFKAPAALEYVFHGAAVGKSAKKVQDRVLLARVLEVIAGAWPKLPSTAKNAVTIRGLGRYLVDNPKVNDDRLIRGLSKLQPSEIAQRAVKLREGRGSMSASSPEDFSEAVAAIYARTR